MSDNKKSAATKVITGTGRLSYAFIWEAHEQDDGEAKFSTSFLIPKTDTETIKNLQAAINAAAERGKSKLWGGKYPKGLKSPLRDGDKEADEKGEEYAGHYFINASSKVAPGIVDRKKQYITDQDEVYSGCYARIIVNMFPYDAKGNKGVGCGLNHIQKVGDGEPLGGTRGKAENEFDDLLDDDGGGGGSPSGQKANGAPPVFDDSGDLPFGDDDDGDLPFGEDDRFVA